MSIEPPFGAYAPSPAEARWRGLAERLPYTYWGRKIASLLLGPAGGRDRAPKDVEVFGDQRARLHPFDNIAEKRVYLTPQHWDPEERLILERIINRDCGGAIRFIDIGANAGLYTLFARSAARRAGKGFAALCVEPDPVMTARLETNLEFSGASAEVQTRKVAVAAAAGHASLAINEHNRGMNRLTSVAAPSVPGAPVETKPLAAVIAEWGGPPPTILKIDIEGGERTALEAFFKDAPKSHWPAVMQTEISHEGGQAGVLRRLCEQHGYRPLFENRLNLILERAPD